ncbi:MAG: deoxyribodipyrimidine photo-lyase [Acidilobaceae archaeon]
MTVIMWFKRDLRVYDNRALERAVKLGEVLPVFVIDPDILDSLEAYDSRLGFVITALEKLSEELPLRVYVGKTEEVFRNLLEKYRPKAVVTAEAGSWSGELRVAKIERLCAEKKVRFVKVFDNYLADYHRISGFWSFSSFYRKWRNLLDLETSGKPSGRFVKAEDEPTWLDAARVLKYQIGRFTARDAEKHLEYDFRNYKWLRRKLDGSSQLSPYIRFGVLSIRHVYAEGRHSEDFVRELAWREYWYALKAQHPYMNTLELRAKRRGISWRNLYIEAFYNGETGYPIIDAAIRQLKEEKWIHNRLRMLLASFFTKDLLGDWRLGEAFFRKHLIDYDEVVNVGNWQWVASVGTDYTVRIFNPVKQARELDPHCVYIKRYLPELEDVSCDCLHDPVRCRVPNYLPPIVDYRETRRKVAELFKRMV